MCPDVCGTLDPFFLSKPVCTRGAALADLLLVDENLILIGFRFENVHKVVNYCQSIVCMRKRRVP